MTQQAERFAPGTTDPRAHTAVPTTRREYAKVALASAIGTMVQNRKMIRIAHFAVRLRALLDMIDS